MHLMIRPIMPYDVPKLTENPFVLISGFVLLFMAMLTAFVLSRYAASEYKGNKKKATIFFVGITAFVTLMLFCFFGCAATAVKGCIFCLLLLLSSYEDIRIRECKDYVHLMIVIAAFIGTDMAALPGMLLSALLVGGIMLITTVITKSQIGGADIKLSAASAFLLGIKQGFAGLMLGLIAAIFVNIIKNRKKKNTGFPLVPYLAAGFMAAYFI